MSQGDAADALGSLDTLFRQPDGDSGKSTGSPGNLRIVLDSDAISRIALALSDSYRQTTAATERFEHILDSRSAELASLGDRLTLVFETIADGLLIFSRDGSLQTANRAAKRIFGIQSDHPSASFAGMLFRELTGPAAEPGATYPVALALPDNRQLDLEVTVLPLADRDEQLVLVQVHDVTAHREAQRRLREQSFIAENVEGFVLINRIDGLIDWANPYFYRKLGYRPDLVNGMRFDELIVGPDGHDGMVAALREQMEDGQRISEEVILRCENGRRVWVEINGFPMNSDSGSMVRYMLTGQEITEKKLEEQQYVDFCSMVSHELRTPLTVVSGTYEALKSDLVPDLPDIAKELLDMGARNCEQLSMLVDDIIDINKLEAGKVRLRSEVFEVAVPVREAVRAVEQSCDAGSLNVQLSVPETGLVVRADPQRLQQVVVNLLANAAKFSPPGVAITVRAFADDNVIGVVIEDSGPGVPVDFLPHLFGKFARAQIVQAQGVAGFGLGLSICKNLMEQMGGSIHHETIHPTGARFVVQLPIEAS